MRVDDFDFHLPDDLIAQAALPRGEARLLVLDRASGVVTHGAVRQLPGFLVPGDLIVVNDSRVFPARLLGRRVPSGGAVECLLLRREPESAAPASAAGAGEATAAETWSALVHPGQKLKPGALVRFEHPAGVLMAEILDRLFFGRRRIRLWAEEGGNVDALVDAMGHVPLPPYIRRADSPEDRERYQTVFAAARGSIAAPTAGLHFDDAMLADLAASGIARTAITLHVGYGTFSPIRVDEVEQHVVEPESYEISPGAAAAINSALDEGRRVIAVGTTTTRALEDAARRGNGRIGPGRAEADLFIHPAAGRFDFQVVSGLMTNFHLPRSSLLMLVAAFAGVEPTLAAYREAVAAGYRFYSYGDAMLIV